MRTVHALGSAFEAGRSDLAGGSRLVEVARMVVSDRQPCSTRRCRPVFEGPVAQAGGVHGRGFEPQLRMFRAVARTARLPPSFPELLLGEGGARSRCQRCR